MRIATRGTTAIALALLAMPTAWSADPAPAASASQAAPSKEVREKMAALHEQMATCLRSDKSVAECRTELMKGCRESQTCPMMGMGGGMRRGHMTQAPPATDKK
jgi:hypothetical protein